MTTNNHSYYTFGLSIQSTLPIPQLMERANTGEPNIRVEWEQFDWPEEGKSAAFMSPTDTYIDIQEVAQYHIQNGAKVGIQPANPDNPDLKSIQLFLLGTIMAVILMQRKIIPLHACCVTDGQNAHLFCADSGTGKSTLAAALLQRGLHVICDDLCVIKKNQAGEYEVYPGYPNIKLWQHSLDRLSTDQLNPSKNQLVQIREDMDKYYYVTKPRWCPDPVRLASINQYVTSPDNNKPIIKSLSTLEKMSCLRQYVFRPYLIDAFDYSLMLFDHSHQLIRQASMCRLERPTEGFDLDALCELVMNKIILHKQPHKVSV